MGATPAIDSPGAFGPQIRPRTGRRRNEKAQRHWIYCHDAVKHGYPLLAPWLMEIETGKMLDRKRLIGDVVHLITSTVTGSRYQLVAYFEVLTAKELPATKYRPKPVLSVGARMVNVYTTRVELGRFEWFRELVEKGGLKSGLGWVRDPAVVEGLVECAGTCKARTVVG